MKNLFGKFQKFPKQFLKNMLEFSKRHIGISIKNIFKSFYQHNLLKDMVIESF
jgi:hypothetical protein